jgi:2,3-bisphosphoglycerate-independent phosphoglycerate mutase
LDAIELPVDGAENADRFAEPAGAAVRELAKKDFVYLHAGLSDGVLHATDIQEKVRAIEQFDAQLVGPLVKALDHHPSYRLLLVCDPGLANSQAIQAPPILYALRDSGGQVLSGIVKRFHEQEEHLVGAAPRDATKLIARLFPRGA